MALEALVASAPFLLLAAAWEAVAASGIFPDKLFPSLLAVFATLGQTAIDGILWEHTAGTLVRLLLGFFIAAAFGVVLGILMGRFRVIEELFLPAVSFGYPIPGLAYAPLFMLWFGLGDVPAVLLVAVASCFVIILNSWKGVKAVRPLWLRAAEVMGANERQIFWKIMMPATLPYVLNGLRLGLAQAWRILVIVEMLMAVDRGLGWMIFGAREFLNTDVMLCGVIVIGIVGLLLEKQVFERIERYTVVRWGMLTG